MTISQGFGKHSSDFVSWVVCSPQHDCILASQTRTLEPTFGELYLSTEVKQYRELAEHLLQREELRSCPQIHHLQAALVPGQVIIMT